jgi:hypothetical protein
LSFGIFEQNKRKDGTTMNIPWEIICWSFKALFDGVWPTQKWDGTPFEPGSEEAALGGQPLANGFFGVPFVLKGDWQHFAKTFKLAYHNANKPCSFCKCNQGPDSEQQDWPSNFRKDARWKSQLVSGRAWRRENAGNLHSIFKAFHFLSTDNVEPDEMHVVHLGTSQYLLGTVLHILVFERLGKRPLAAMEQIWGEICDEYKRCETSAQYSSLGLSSFTDPKAPLQNYPRLKGRAAEVKGLVPVLAQVWKRHQRTENETDRLVDQLLEQQMLFQELLDEDANAFHLSTESATELCKVTDKLLSLYSKLAHQADGEGALKWTMAPKHHMLWHLSRKASFMHPRRGACYQDEDFMGRVKALVTSCTHALPLHAVATTVLKKYRWAMFFSVREVRGVVNGEN